MGFFKLGFVWCVLMIINLGVVSAGNAQNYQLHTVYMYSFTKYIQWPNLSEESFNIGVLGENSALIPHLEKLATSKMVGQRRIQIKIFSEPGEISTSEMLFISSEWSKDEAFIEDWMERARKEHFLILTEDLPTTGLSHINFVVENEKLFFELNRQRIESSGLRVATELLALARIVDNQEHN